MLSSLNHELFFAIDASAHPPSEVLAIARFLAQWMVYISMAVPVGLWIWGDRTHRGALLATTLGIIVALLFNQLIGTLWYEPRPFVIHLGHTWLAHAPDNSFPSDHATFLWALGFGLAITRASRPWGLIVSLLGLSVAWARIYVGVHYPIDMAGSSLTAAVGAGIAWAGVPPTCRWLLPIADFIYDNSLWILRASPSIFPRKDHD